MTTPADSHDQIQIRGARENNLKSVSLDIPKRRITVFTGVSGSGKSSLVFGTVAAESRRLINETYATFVQNFMPSQAQPEADALGNLSAAIIVDQERMGANSRSTVGTATDVYPMLRTLYSRIGNPHIGGPDAFSFNVPSISGAGAVTFEKGGKTVKERREFSINGGMCPECEGLGQVNTVDLAQLFDENKSIQDGAITVPTYGVGTWNYKLFAESGLYPADKPVKKFTAKQREDFLYTTDIKVKVNGINMSYEGLVPRVQRQFLSKDRESAKKTAREFMDRAATYGPCPACEGTRLNEAARSVTINGKNIADCVRMQISELAEFLGDITDTTVAPLLAKLQDTLGTFVKIGLGYLSLDREAGTLSGGEAQRTKMVRHLGSALTDISYVFDEPTVGLHPHDIARMNELLVDLRDKGNTILVVEHKPEVIERADHIVDMGPLAGSKGGELVYQGDVAGLRTSGTLTGKYLGARTELKAKPRKATKFLEIKNANQHNLQNVSVKVPLGVLTAVTGVAGSGKSSLIHGNLPGREGVLVVDQSSIQGSRRSNPATYTGLLDTIRDAFAKANGVKPGLFSANSEGACPKCHGLGLIYTDLGFMQTVTTVCEECEGKRFTPEVLEYTLNGKNIADVYAMSFAEAREFFSAKEFARGKMRPILERMNDVGLEYLTLGQPLNTLSGGERQRLKLAIHMAGKASVYVLDEPTSGLHMADVDKLLQLLDKLVDDGNTVVVIEHHLGVVAHADWAIDLGPGAGHDGGTVVFEGTPEELVQANTLTGEHLKEYVG